MKILYFFFLVFFFIKKIENLAIYIKSHTFCRENTHQDGTLNYPYCPLINGLIQGENISLNSNETSLFFYLLDEYYEINESDDLKTEGIFSQIKEKTINIIGNGLSEIELKTSKIRFSINANLTIKNVKIFGGGLFYSNIIKTSFTISFQNISDYFGLFNIYPNSKNNRLIVFENCMFDQINYNSQINSYSSFININDNSSNIQITNCTFSNFFFPQAFIYMPSQNQPSLTLKIENSSFSNYNTLGHSIIFENFNDNEILALNYKYMFGMSQIKAILLLNDVLIENISSFLNVNNSILFCENLIIKEDFNAYDPNSYLMYLNSTLFKPINLLSRFPRNAFLLDYKNTFIGKYIYIENCSKIMPLFDLRTKNSLNLQYFYLLDLNIVADWDLSLFHSDSNNFLTIKNIIAVNIYLDSHLFAFRKSNRMGLYDGFFLNINGTASNSLIKFKLVVNSVNLIVMKAIFFKGIQMKSIFSGSCSENDCLKISNVSFDNQGRKLDYFYQNNAFSNLIVYAKIEDSYFKNLLLKKFFTEITNSNIYISNTIFFNFTTDMGLISTRNSSTLSLNTINFTNILNGYNLNYDSLERYGYFIGIFNSTLSMKLIIFENFSVKISILKSVFLKLTDDCVIEVMNMKFEKLYENLTFFQGLSRNTIHLYNVALNQIKIDDTRSLMEIEDRNYLYLSDTNISYIMTKGGGAVLKASQKNSVWVKHCDFSNLYAFELEEGKGGAFFFQSGNSLYFLINNFINVTTVFGGLGYFLFENTIVITRCAFISVSSRKNAACLFLSERNVVDIKNSTFLSQYSIQDSGLFFLSIGNTLNLVDVSIEDAISNLCGGVLYALNENLLTMRSCNFSNSFAILSGALFYLASSNTLIIDRVHIINCYGYKNSFSIDMNRFNIFQSSFMVWENSAGVYSGFRGEMQVNNWELKNNKEISVIDSNSIDFNQDLMTISFFSCFYCEMIGVSLKFMNYTNNALFYADKGNITLFNIIIRNNTIIEDKSFFYIKQSLFKCFYLSFSQNQGNIFSIVQSQIEFRSIKFVSSGYFFLESLYSTINVTRSFFIYPHKVYKANENSHFSGIIILKYSFFSLKKSSLISGIAQNGGAISLTYSKLIFEDNICLLNKAFSNGGCLFINYDSDGNAREFYDRLRFEYSKDEILAIKQLNFTRSLFISNAAIKGGAIYLYSEYLNNSFIANISKIRAKHLILRDNKANQGGAFYKDEISSIEANDLKFISNYALVINKTHFGRGGAYYTNCSWKCSSQFDWFKNIKYFKNKASFGGAIFLEKTRDSNFDAFGFVNKEINFSQNYAEFYGNDLATITVNIALYRKNSYTNEPHLQITNLKSGFNYPCLFYVIGSDFFGNIVNQQENPLGLTIKERNNNSLHDLQLIPDNNNILCAKNTLISNPRPNLNLFYEISYNSNLMQEYNRLTVNLKFRSCEIGERQTDDFRCESCQPGYYSFRKNSTEKCLPCEKNSPFYCLGSSFIGPKEGYWRVDYYSDNFIKCPNPSSCLGYYVSDPIYYQKDKSKGLCRKGYEGVLCAECAKGYGITNGYYCTSCNSFWYYSNILFFFFFRLFLIIYSLHSAVAMCTSAAAGLLKTKEIISATIIKILLNHFQVLNIIVSFPFEWKRSIFDILSIGMAVSPSISDSYSVQCLFQALNINISTQYVKIVSNWFSILILMGICYAYHRLYLTKKIKFYLKFIKKTENDILESTYFIILFIVYLDLLSVCLETFSCRNIGYENFVEYRLIKDYSVKCWDENHKGWAYGLVVPFLVLFGVGFPISILFVLVQKYRKKKLNRQDLMLRYGYFYLSYERHYFYWDFVILIRKILLTSVNIFLLVLYTGVFSYIVTIMLAILLVFLYLQIECKPYLRKELKSVNNLEKYSLISLSGTMFLAIFGYDQNFSNDISMFLLIFSISLNIGFFSFWCILYYQSEFQKTLKTIIYFTKLLLKYFCNKCVDCFSSPRIVQNFSRRRGIFNKGKDKIVIDIEKHNEEMQDRETDEGIIKIIPPKNFQFQLDFNHFSIENSNGSKRVRPMMGIRRMHSNTSQFERASSSSNEINTNRYSKFFTIDSSPRGGGFGQNKIFMDRSEIENLKLENKSLNDRLKKAHKEIYNLKYLFIVHQDFNSLEGKEQMEKDLQEDEFFLQEILINYENFLKAIENSEFSENNKRALIQSEGVLYRDERIHMAFSVCITKIKTNNPTISMKLRISNISFLYVYNLKVSYNNSEIMQVFPDINDVTLFPNQFINQNIVIPYKIALLSPLTFKIFYQMKSEEKEASLLLPISLWTLIKLVAGNQMQFKSLWRKSDSFKVKYKANEFKDSQYLLNIFENDEIFKNYLITFKNDENDLKKYSSLNEKQKLGKFGIMFRTLHDDRPYLMKFTIAIEGIYIISKVLKNDVESYRLLENLIDTFLSILK